MVGIEGGTELARGDEAIFLDGVVEPETEDGGDGGNTEGNV